MGEHFPKVAAIHPPAAHRASIKYSASPLGGWRIRRPLYLRRGNSMIGLCCSAIGSSDTRNPARVFELRAGPAPQSHHLTANQRRGSYSLPSRLQSINLNGKTKPPNGAEPNAELSVAVMVETGDSNLSHPP